MATKPLDGQMKALKSATDSVPRMGLYDINTPQSVREGTPLRLFSPDRARYSQGDVVDDKKAYSQALAVYNTKKEIDICISAIKKAKDMLM